MRFYWTGQRGAEPVCGEIVAPSHSMAKLQLLLRGIELDAVRRVFPLLRWLRHRRLVAQLPRLVRRMALLAEAGLPLYEVVRLLAQQAESGLRVALGTVEARLAQGYSPAQAFADTESLNDAVLITGLRAGQASGNMAGVLLVLADNLQVRETFRRQVRKAAAYPLVLLCTAIGVCLLTLLWLVPLYADLYRDHVSLPASTEMLFSLSAALSQPRWWALVSALVALAGLLRLPQLARWRSRLLLATPLLGRLARIGSIAQMLQLLALLVASRVGLSEAIELCRQQTTNPLLAEALQRARTRMESGSAPGDAFADARFGTDLVPLMVLSDRSGNLAGVVQSAAEYYTALFRDEMAQKLSLVEPLTVLLLGLLTGGLLVVLYLPLFSMGQAF